MVKRTLASRVLSFVAAMLVAVSSIFVVASPLVSAKKAPPSIFILMQGIDSQLSKDNIKNDVTPGFESIKTAITQAVPDAQFITYSYTGPTSKTDPKPRPYTCVPTIETPLSVDIKLLDRQIQAAVANKPHANIYLVAHSMGGVVAFGYLAALEETNIVKSLPNANLKGVITLDSPIGGVSSDSNYFTAAVSFFELSCPGFTSQLSTAPLNLTSIFDSLPTNGDQQPRGGKASVLAIPFRAKDRLPDPLPINQQVATDAQSNGIASLTIGNWNDIMWDPSVCGMPVNQFVATQWIQDRGDNSGIYGRAITSGDTNNCFLAGFNQANHLKVLTDPDVMQAIQQFITGQTPSALPFAHGES